MTDEKRAFKDHVAERRMLRFDIIVRCDILPASIDRDNPSDVSCVVLDVEYANLQDIMAIKVISSVAAEARNLRHHHPTLDARGRAGFQVGNFVCARQNVAQSLQASSYIISPPLLERT
jgi:hypothetical protein